MKEDKPTKSDIIEANNLLEEVSEILEPCIKCGRFACRGASPSLGN